jgi:hypothetical protein
VPSGSTLVAFTDGLVERQIDEWAAVVGRVRSAIERVRANWNASSVADVILAQAAGERSDDIALLVVRCS